VAWWHPPVATMHLTAGEEYKGKYVEQL